MSRLISDPSPETYVPNPDTPGSIGTKDSLRRVFPTFWRLEPAERAFQLLPELRIVRHPVEPLARSMWSMRDTLTAYDAACLAVAQNINARLLTTDRRLAAAAERDERLVKITAP